MRVTLKHLPIAVSMQMLKQSVVQCRPEKLSDLTTILGMKVATVSVGESGYKNFRTECLLLFRALPDVAARRHSEDWHESSRLDCYCHFLDIYELKKACNAKNIFNDFVLLKPLQKILPSFPICIA